ncbi:MAG: DUF4258 domain-containing protein [Candidatus Pacebacteria bacterium]|nr:DUF4258 domain-containing protein [Candidatus Paceibacterota bacterium]MCF7862634.1 DUF4258 domain-containing protein [Candidatus Paceibacterota bacterium]
MKIFFTKHFKQRLKERSISIFQIYQIIKYPDYREKVHQDRILLRKHFGSRSINLICVIKNKKIIIITTYSK